MPSNGRFTTREIAEMFSELREHQKQTNATLASVNEQTIKTNGRVRALEVWRGFITGGLGVLTALVLPVAYAVVKEWMR